MDPFIGQLGLFPYSFVPLNWMQCAGQLLNVGQYSALFGLLGTRYGGNGTTTFGLPDLRGRTPLGAGACTTGTKYLLGQKGGVDTVALVSNQVPPHNHSLPASTQDGTTLNPTGAVIAQGPSEGGHGTGVRPYYYTAPGGARIPLPAATCSPAGGGGGQGHNNLQPYLAMAWCIAVNGIFPSRP
jgi:microcystin-dependent protein